MTAEELYEMMAEHVKDEYEDVVKYVKMSKTASSQNLDGPAQIFKDIAHEEYIHAQHVENILREMNALKEDNFGLRKNAREALDSL